MEEGMAESFGIACLTSSAAENVLSNGYIMKRYKFLRLENLLMLPSRISLDNLTWRRVGLSNSEKLGWLPVTLILQSGDPEG